MFYFITIVVFLFGILLTCIRGRKFEKMESKNIRKLLGWISKNDINEYFVNTMIAFLGVTSAIAFTNFNTLKEEKNQTINYLEEVLLAELDTKGILATEAMLELNPNAYLHVTIGGEGITEENTSVENEQKFESEDIFQTVKRYPISPVLSLDMLLTNAPYMHTISEYTYSALISSRSSLALQKIRLEDAETIEEMQKHLEYMIIDFNHTRKVVEIELEYQKGNIKKDDVYNQIDKLFEELKENEDVLVIG